MQGPEVYLNDLGIGFTCIVDTDKPAVLDGAHRVLLNYESYYFSSKEARSQFLEAPHPYCGRVTDVVTRERFEPAEASPRRELNGRVFLFSSAETAAQFDEAPDDFATPMPGMVPVSG